MKRLALFGVPLRIHPTLPLMALLAAQLNQPVLIAALSLTAHELMHVLAARLIKIEVAELELMPFGGAARIDRMWSLRPAQLILIVLAGPATNLLILLTASAFHDFGFIGTDLAARIVQINLVLCLFNLLPALPLDGGRLLSAALSAQLGPDRAVRVGVAMAWALAATLLIAAAATFVIHRRINVTLLLLAVYVAACAPREIQLTQSAAIRSLVDRQSELASEETLPIRWLAAADGMTASELARSLRPRRLHVIAVYRPDLSFGGVIAEKDLLKALMAKPDAYLRELVDPETARNY